MDQNREQKIRQSAGPVDFVAEALDIGPEKSKLRVRCPECLKLYAVNTAEISESRPRFECVDCHTHFWFSYPEALDMGDEILAYPMSWLEPETEFRKEQEPAKSSKASVSTQVFSCPKCGQAYAAGDTECVKCGVVFLKIKESPRPDGSELSVAPEVRDAWQAVLDTYENFETHQNFINAAWADRSLPYAAEQYQRILDVCPQDELAQKAQKQVDALNFARFESQAPLPEPNLTKGIFNGLELSIRKMKFTTLIFFMCGIVIALGFFIPHMRNLVGVGTAVMFFVLALRYYFRVI